MADAPCVVFRHAQWQSVQLKTTRIVFARPSFSARQRLRSPRGGRRSQLRRRVSMLPIALLSSLADASCGDKYESCFRWAVAGQCEKLIPFMQMECSCSCSKEPAATDDPCTEVADAIKPNGITTAFGRALTLEQFTPRLISADPLIVVLDSFASEAESSELAALAEATGFGARGSSCGYKKACNSASMSCLPINGSACWMLDPMRRFEERMLSVLGVPADNCEPLRFFRYNEGETFRRHHDAAGQGDLPPDTPGGPRVYSLYTFLEAPGQGGEFNFPALNLSIPAKPGRAVLWPHLRDGDVSTPDERTEHEGAPVLTGRKIGVNLHAHRNNLRTRVLAGCNDGTQKIKHTFQYESTNGSTPLHDMVGLHSSAVLPLLIESGADVNAVDASGTTALMLAAGRGLDEDAWTLILANVSVDLVDSGGNSALHHAAWQGNADVARVLATVGARTDAVNAQGGTPLHLAAKHGFEDVLKVLVIEGDGPLDQADAKGCTALHLAARHGHMDAMLVLLAAGATIGAVDAKGATPLHMASAEGHVEAVLLLISDGAAVNQAGGRGTTPLHLAAGLGQVDVMKALLDAGAEHSAADNDGARPLHLAAQQGHAKAVGVLLDAGASWHAPDRAGYTPLDVANMYDQSEVEQMLVRSRRKTDLDGFALSAVVVLLVALIARSCCFGRITSSGSSEAKAEKNGKKRK